MENEIEFIKFDKLPHFESINSLYCKAIQPLVDKIFDGEMNNHIIGYQKSTERNIHYNNFKSHGLGQNDIDRLIEKKYQEPLENKFNDTNKLGILEIGFLNFLLLNNERLLILKGYRGTGKSELIRFISKYFVDNIRHENCPYKSTCTNKVQHIIIDFIENEFSNSDFSRDFSIRVFNEIGASFGKIISGNRISFIDDFVKYCIEINSTYFFDIQEAIVDKYNNWFEFSERKKYNIIFGWIRNRFENNYIENGLSALFEIVKFYHNRFNRNFGCLMLIMDNIDKLNIEQQNIVIGIADGISRSSGFQIVIPVRLTTLNNVGGYANHLFNICTNIGYPPLELCILRMKHYIENKEKYSDYYNCKLIPDKYIDAFDKRINFIYGKLTSLESKYKYERLDKTLNSLAGVSIRKCLRLFRRMFMNFCIEWIEPCPVEDLLIRSLLTYQHSNGKMNTNIDKRIHNMFQNIKTKSLTLNNLRILNTISYCEKNSIPLTVNELSESLCLYHGANQDEFNILLSNLWRQGKRVIILSDVGVNESKSKISKANIELTKSGYGHLEYLSSSLQYLQCCFEVIDLNEKIVNEITNVIYDYLNIQNANTHLKKLLDDSLRDIDNKTFKYFVPKHIDYSNFNERIRFIRIMLRLLYLKDVVETIQYKIRYINTSLEIKSIAKISNLVSVPILIGISNSILNITQNKAISFDERKLWIDLIRLVNEWNKFLFPRSDFNNELDKMFLRISSDDKLN